jgi:hypothetical protein
LGIFSIFHFSYLVMKCGDILDIIITICLWFGQDFFCCYSMYYIIYFVMLKMHDLQSHFFGFNSFLEYLFSKVLTVSMPIIYCF